MLRRRLAALVMACAATVSLAAAAAAQTFTGGISGTVTDPTGGLVPEAQIRLINLDRGTRRTLVTGSSGTFNFTAVTPGRYRVEAELSGFKTFAQEPVEIRVQQFLVMEVTLALGSTSDSVEVNAGAPLIDVTTSSLGAVVENKQITDIPVNGRNTLAFVGLAPGVRTQGEFGSNPATTNFQTWGNFSANGGISNGNDVLVDGASVTTMLFNGVGYLPPVDATQEFKVQTNNFSAEFGRTAGGVVNLTTKSGTNEFHGSVYEFMRDDGLDSKDYFAEITNRPKADFSMHQFGASLGGPIRRDSTFFFVNVEGFRQNDGRTFLSNQVATEAERRGDFSQSPGVAIRDPFTRLPFPGNVIPADRVNPVGVNLLNALHPLPNTGSDRYASTSVQESREYQVLGRLDHYIGTKWRFSATYGYQHFDLGGWDPLGNQTTTTDSGRQEVDKMQNGVLSATGFFSPRFVGEFRVNYTKIDAARTPMSLGFDLSTLGWPTSFAEGVPVKAFPLIDTVTGYQAVNASTVSQQYRVNTNLGFSAGFTVLREKHTIKFGGQFRRLLWDEDTNNNGSPRFQFNGTFSGNALADMLLGYPSLGEITQSERLYLDRNYLALFVQDDWKPSSKLTINAGLQWSIDLPLRERDNRTSWFDTSALPPSSAELNLPYPGSLVFASDERPNADEYYWKQFAPRLGAAYQINARTVVRGGFGISWLPSSAYSRTGAPTWFRTPQSYLTTLDGRTPAPGSSFSDPFPVLYPPPGNSDTWDKTVRSITQGLPGVSYGDDHVGHMRQWNFGIQRDFGHNLAVELAYAGSRGYDLPQDRNLNQLDPDLYALGATALNAQVANPWFGYVPRPLPQSSATVPYAQLLRQYPQFNAVILGPIGAGRSSYQAVEVRAQKRFANSLIQAAYTWSRSKDNIASSVTTFAAGESAAPLLDVNDPDRDFSLSFSDVPHRFVLSYTIELPWRDKQGWGRLVSGWQLTGLYVWQTGVPIPLVARGAANAFFYTSTGNRPLWTGQNPKLDTPESERVPIPDPNKPGSVINQTWFDTTQYKQPADFVLGDAPRTNDDLRGDNMNQLDLGVFKNNRFGRYNLQLRFEVFNLFNDVQFGLPGRDVSSSSAFGVVTTQSNRPRQIQLAVKFLF